MSAPSPIRLVSRASSRGLFGAAPHALVEHVLRVAFSERIVSSIPVDDLRAQDASDEELATLSLPVHE